MKLVWTITLGLLVLSGCDKTSAESSKKPQQVTTDSTHVSHTDTAKTARPAEPDTAIAEDLPAIFTDLISVFNSRDTTAINGILSTELGFHYITNPGAFTVVFSESPAKLFSQYEWLDTSATANMQFGAAPQYSCDTESWDKEGVFITENPEFTLKDIYNIMLEYELTEQAISQQLIDADAAISHLVYDTQSSTGFYFGKFKGEWKLIGINIVTHCSA